MIYLLDFIAAYNVENNKNMILVLSKYELEEARQTYKGHNYKEEYLRAVEPKMLVHSTTIENYYKIKKMEC